MLKKITILFMAIMMIVSVTACSTESSTEANKKQAEFPVTITDAAGREVTIEKEPEKLVSGYYITTSMIMALNQQDKLVGIENKAEKRQIYKKAAPELLELPGVGTLKAFDLEGCAALEPDLVILPLKLKDYADTLAELGINAIVVNPESMSQMKDTITILGTATGSLDRAEELLKYLGELEGELKKAVSDNEKPSVYLAGNDSYLRTAGAEMYQNTLIDIAGGLNVAKELPDDYWVEISYEQLLTWNPSVIILASDAEYTVDDLKNDPQLSDIDAVKNNRIYAMPSDFEAWDSPVPGAMIGSAWVASVLHADVYSQDDFIQDAADFYQRFYGVDAEEVKKSLSNEETTGAVRFNLLDLGIVKAAA